MDGQPPSNIYQKELRYWLEIRHLDFTQKIKTRWNAMYAYSPSPGWSPAIPRMITRYPKDGHPLFKIYQKKVY